MKRSRASVISPTVAAVLKGNVEKDPSAAGAPKGGMPGAAAPTKPEQVIPERADLAWIAQVLSERAQQQPPSTAHMFVDRANSAVSRLDALVRAAEAKV